MSHANHLGDTLDVSNGKEPSSYLVKNQLFSITQGVDFLGSWPLGIIVLEAHKVVPKQVP